MLEKDVIPKTEPEIDVGIVLPEDEFTSLTLELPSDQDYQIEFSGRTFLLEPSTEILFRRTSDGIHFRIGEHEYSAPNEIKLFPVFRHPKLQPQVGVKVKNVVTGRSFHWRKYIHVILPETLILKPHEKHLLLINRLPLEKYLMCVATSEMGADCPIALLEAQTIAARSWLLANVEQKHRHLGMDVCNDDCCQRYQGTTFLSEESVQATMNTTGLVLLFQGKICDARYSKSCGGVMEAFENIWESPPLPYFAVKADAEKDPPEWNKPLSDEANFKKWVNSTPHTFCSPHVIPEPRLKKYLGKVDEQGRYFRWKVEISQQNLVQNLQKHFNLQIESVKKLEVTKRGGSGRATRLRITYINFQNKEKHYELKSEYDIRLGLHPSFLYSSAIIIEVHPEGAAIPDRFTFHGAGWGHGVGLCQIGALGMSLKGYSSEEIVQHYYAGSQLKKIY